LLKDLEKKINEWKELYTDDISAFDKYIKLDVSILIFIEKEGVKRNTVTPSKN